MDTPSGTVTVWQSGRLAPHVGTRRLAFTLEQWLGAAVLLLCALVMAIYVGVLERDVSSSEMAHMAQRSRAAAEAQCEADQPAQRRSLCLALFNGDVAVAEPQAPVQPAPGEVRYEQDNAARAVTVSLVGR